MENEIEHRVRRRSSRMVWSEEGEEVVASGVLCDRRRIKDQERKSNESDRCSADLQKVITVSPAGRPSPLRSNKIDMRALSSAHIAVSGLEKKIEIFFRPSPLRSNKIDIRAHQALFWRLEKPKKSHFEPFFAQKQRPKVFCSTCIRCCFGL